jgi:transcriptional regulator with GAF, ATPase, and Fis domain
MAGRKKSALCTDSARELREARARQAGTAAILKLIARSPSNAQPVFEGIMRRARKLCEAPIAGVILLDGDMLRLASFRAQRGVLGRFAKLWPMLIAKAGVQGLVVRQRVLVNVRDVESDRRVAKWAIPLYRSLRIRSGLWVPMIQKGAVVGMIAAFRHEPQGFSSGDENLLATFADQAVIAIENARLFRELRSSDERYDVAMRAVNEGVYDWDIENDTIFYSDRVYKAVGLSREDYTTPRAGATASTRKTCRNTTRRSSRTSRARRSASSATSATAATTANGTGRASTASRCATRRDARSG